MLTTAFSALALGLLSSVHCVGMCGPLLLAVNPHPLLYHTGRISTYAGAGLFSASSAATFTSLAGNKPCRSPSAVSSCYPSSSGKKKP